MLKLGLLFLLVHFHLCQFYLSKAVFIYIPYYRKLTLHEIEVLEINAT